MEVQDLNFRYRQKYRWWLKHYYHYLDGKMSSQYQQRMTRTGLLNNLACHSSHSARRHCWATCRLEWTYACSQHGTIVDSRHKQAPLLPFYSTAANLAWVFRGPWTRIQFDIRSKLRYKIVCFFLITKTRDRAEFPWKSHDHDPIFKIFMRSDFRADYTVVHCGVLLNKFIFKLRFVNNAD